MKYSDCLADWLVHLGYSHCFYVGGGNIMHLVESLSRKLICCAVINEVAAGIAAEYFNETSFEKKAFALVTAGPGLTNIVTAVAGAYMESRELLVIGGQVKVPDLAHGKVRQRGIQEIDGVSLLRSITVFATRIDAPVDYKTFFDWVMLSKSDRKGPVFLEIPLDVQACQVAFDIDQCLYPPTLRVATVVELSLVRDKIRNAKRPLLLIGGGIRRSVAASLVEAFSSAEIPVATTWNGADRLPANHSVYVGRPNTWGQRSANLILQQADMVIALGTRLGLQQTGFNWQQFVPSGDVVHVDIDPSELDKGHPRISMKIAVDANDFLIRLMGLSLGDHSAWLTYARNIRTELPLIEAVNVSGDGYISPYTFV